MAYSFPGERGPRGESKSGVGIWKEEKVFRKRESKTRGRKFWVFGFGVAFGASGWAAGGRGLSREAAETSRGALLERWKSVDSMVGRRGKRPEGEAILLWTFRSRLF